jgi:hypothetical protein
LRSPERYFDPTIVEMIPVANTAHINSTTSVRVKRMWGFDLHSWEQIMLWSLGCAAIAALAVTVSTTAVVFLQKEESEASKHELEVYKADSGKKISAAEAVGMTAQADIAKANSEIAKAHEGIALANARAAEANLKAETERAERVKLELRLAPRTISPQQLTAQLSGLSGLRVDLIAYETNGQDVPTLAGQINAGLSAAGMTAHVFTPFADGTVVRGILVRCADDAPDDAKAAVTRLVTALSSVGLAAGPWAPFPANEPPAGGYNGPTGVVADAKIRILVGGKP